MSERQRIIRVDAMARVEGEGALYVRIKDDQVEELQFRIFEPPRYFEALLRGRDFREAPDITARICGICPVAYLLGASQAMEDALDVTVSGPLRDLRRLLYCGEWIESHVLHAAMLHAPDFLGLDDVLQIARTEPELVAKALRLKKLGNDVMTVIGGRAVHPVNLKVGGFYRLPEPGRLQALLPELNWALAASRELALAFADFEFPQLEMDYTYVSLRHPDEYAIHEGRIVSSRGLDIPLREFLDHFREEHVEHSTALYGRMADGSAYLVGPLARYNNNYGQLSDAAKTLAAECGMGPAEHNPYRSILVRMVETYYACEEAIRLIEGYRGGIEPAVSVEPHAAIGVGCTEAPRGICFHRYELDGAGLIRDAVIMPPTAQNQPQMEADLLAVVQRNLHRSQEDLTRRCEQTIRNYDPCISCATHFLKLTIDRE